MAGGSQLGSFGGVVFQVASGHVRTIEELSRKGAAVFADHAVATHKPVTEFTGQELDVVSFPMTLNAELGINPNDEVGKLREMMLKEPPDAHQLVIGGTPYGKFTIRSIDETVMHFIKGEPQVIKVRVTLKEYIESTDSAAVQAQTRDYSAMKRPAKVNGAKEAIDANRALMLQPGSEVIER